MSEIVLCGTKKINKKWCFSTIDFKGLPYVILNGSK